MSGNVDINKCNPFNNGISANNENTVAYSPYRYYGNFNNQPAQDSFQSNTSFTGNDNKKVPFWKRREFKFLALLATVGTGIAFHRQIGEALGIIKKVAPSGGDVAKAVEEGANNVSHGYTPSVITRTVDPGPTKEQIWQNFLNSSKYSDEQVQNLMGNITEDDLVVFLNKLKGTEQAYKKDEIFPLILNHFNGVEQQKVLNNKLALIKEIPEDVFRQISTQPSAVVNHVFTHSGETPYSEEFFKNLSEYFNGLNVKTLEEEAAELYVHNRYGINLANNGKNTNEISNLITKKVDGFVDKHFGGFQTDDSIEYLMSYRLNNAYHSSNFDLPEGIKVDPATILPTNINILAERLLAKAKSSLDDLNSIIPYIQEPNSKMLKTLEGVESSAGIANELNAKSVKMVKSMGLEVPEHISNTDAQLKEFYSKMNDRVTQINKGLDEFDNTMKEFKLNGTPTGNSFVAAIKDTANSNEQVVNIFNNEGHILSQGIGGGKLIKETVPEAEANLEKYFADGKAASTFIYTPQETALSAEHLLDGFVVDPAEIKNPAGPGKALVDKIMLKTNDGFGGYSLITRGSLDVTPEEYEYLTNLAKVEKLARIKCIRNNEDPVKAAEEFIKLQNNGITEYAKTFGHDCKRVPGTDIWPIADVDYNVIRGYNDKALKDYLRRKNIATTENADGYVEFIKGFSPESAENPVEAIKNIKSKAANAINIRHFGENNSDVLVESHSGQTLFNKVGDELHIGECNNGYGFYVKNGLISAWDETTKDYKAVENPTDIEFVKGKIDEFTKLTGVEVTKAPKSEALTEAGLKELKAIQEQKLLESEVKNSGKSTYGEAVNPQRYSGEYAGKLRSKDYPIIDGPYKGWIRKENYDHNGALSGINFVTKHPKTGKEVILKAERPDGTLIFLRELGRNDGYLRETYFCADGKTPSRHTIFKSDGETPDFSIIYKNGERKTLHQHYELEDGKYKPTDKINLTGDSSEKTSSGYILNTVEHIKHDGLYADLSDKVLESAAKEVKTAEAKPIIEDIKQPKKSEVVKPEVKGISAPESAIKDEPKIQETPAASVVGSLNITGIELLDDSGKEFLNALVQPENLAKLEKIPESKQLIDLIRTGEIQIGKPIIDSEYPIINKEGVRIATLSVGNHYMNIRDYVSNNILIQYRIDTKNIFQF